MSTNESCLQVVSDTERKRNNTVVLFLAKNLRPGRRVKTHPFSLFILIIIDAKFWH